MVIGGRTNKVDLVFFHRILKCFVLIDLKRGEVQHDRRFMRSEEDTE